VLAIAITDTQNDPIVLYKSAETFRKLHLIDIAEQLSMRAK
jgi:hypothetical protein